LEYQKKNPLREWC